MPSNEERALSRIINQSWKPLEQFAVAPRTKQALAGAHAYLTGEQMNPSMNLWLASIEGVQEPMAKVIGKQMYEAADALRPVNARLSFNLVDEVSQKYAASQAGLLVKALDGGQRQAIQRVMLKAMSGDLTVDQAARHLHGSIGLHPAWAEAVGKYGDRMFDAAIKDGLPMDKAAEQAFAKQKRYHQRLVRARANNIARTEIQTASNVGTFAGWQNAIGEGYASPQSEKEWSPGPGACKICAPLSGERVQWDQPFSNGSVMPPGHPGCRCSANLLQPDIITPRDIDHLSDRHDPNYQWKPKAPAGKPKIGMPLDEPLTTPPVLNQMPGPRIQPGREVRAYNRFDPRMLDAGDMRKFDYTDGGMPLERAVQGVNPNWGTVEYSRNCTSCATSYEMRRRGFNVQAGGTPGKGRPDSEYISSWWHNQDGTPAVPERFSGKNQFKGWMKEQPPGSRGYVMVQWKGGGGHVFNWEVDEKGVLQYIDVQPGASKGFPFRDYKDWANDAKPQLRAVRMDDKVPNDAVLEAITDVQTEGTPLPSRRRNMIG